MGFWQGINEGLTYVLDKKEARESEENQLAYDREKFERTLFENNRGVAIQVALERGKSKQALEQKLAYGMAIGLTETSSALLLSSGQLDIFLNVYEKNDNIDTEYVTKLNTYLEGSLKDNPALADALMAGINTKKDVSNEGESSLAILEAVLFATNQEDLDKLYLPLYGDSTGVPTTAPFDVNFSGMSGLSSSETAAMRREISSGLHAYFKDSFVYTDSNELRVSQSASPAVIQLLNQAEITARDITDAPNRSMNPSAASQYVVKQIQTALTNSSVRPTADELLANFGAVIKDPVGWAKSFASDPPPTPDTTSVPEVVGAFGDVDTLTADTRWVINPANVINQDQ